MRRPAKAGWYADEFARGVERWWDGARWTDYTRPRHQGPTAGQRILMAIGAFVVASFIGGVVLYLLSADAPSRGTASTRELITLDEFERIEVGMTRAEVVRIVDSPGQVVSEGEIAGISGLILEWEGVGLLGANANVQFQDGLVINKAQFGLE